MYNQKLINMKIHKFYTIFSFLLLVSISLINTGCEDDFEANNTLNTQGLEKKSNPLLSVNYTVTSTIDYDMPPYNLTEFEMSYLNPSSEKNKVSFELFEDGTTNMIIEKQHFNKEIKIPNHILPDDRPEIVKTVISGNTMTIFDSTGKLRGSQNIPIPNQMELVKKIKEVGKNYTAKEINQTIATMQGTQFISNLNDFIANAGANNVQIIEQGDNFVTLRMPLSNVDSNLDQDCVLLIDKSKNRLVGNRIYSSDNKLLQTTYFGYNTGAVQSINAVKTIAKITLPSGFEIDQINLDKIENFKFNLNIK